MFSIKNVSAFCFVLLLFGWQEMNAQNVNITRQPGCGETTGHVIISSTGIYQEFQDLYYGSSASGTKVCPVSSCDGQLELDLVPGVYTAHQTSRLGCGGAKSSTGDKTFTINAPPRIPSTPTLTQSRAPSCANPTADITVTNGFAGDKYSIDGGATWQTGTTFYNLLAGATYIVAVQTVNGCTAPPGSFTTSAAPAIPNPSVQNDYTINCNQAPLRLTTGTAQGGTTYTWSPATDLNNTGFNAMPIMPAVGTGPYSRTYTLTATSTCTVTRTVTVTFDTSTIAANAGTAFTKTCAINTAGNTIGAAPVAGATYSWTPATGLNSATIANPLANPLVTTPYTVSVRKTSTGCIATANVTVTVDTAPPVVDAGADLGKDCSQNINGGNIGPVPVVGHAYSWSPGTGLNVTNQATVFANPAITTIYTLTETGLNGCTATDQVKVVVNNTVPVTPEIPFVKNPDCKDDDTGILLTSLPRTGTWTIGLYDAGTIGTQAAVSETNGNGGDKYIQNIAPGTYDILVTTDGGCVNVVPASATITRFLERLTAPVVVGNVIQPSCNSGGTVDISGLPTTNWSLRSERTSDGTLKVVKDQNGTTYTDTNMIAGTYNYVAISQDGCESPVSANITMDTPNFGVNPVVIDIDQPNCAISTGTIHIANLNTAGWTIHQTKLPEQIPGTPDVIYNGTSTTFDIPNLIAGDYNIEVVNETLCTQQDGSVIVIRTAPNTPVAPQVAVTQPTCSTDHAILSLTDMPAGATTFVCTNTITNVTYTNVGVGPSFVINDVFDVGTYTGHVLTADGCVSPEVTFNIDAQPVTPAAPIVSSTPATCLKPVISVILSSLPSGNWIVNYNGQTLAGSGASTTIESLAEGIYNFSVTAENTCTSLLSAPIDVPAAMVVPTAPTIGAIVAPTCFNAEGTVTIGGLPNGVWSLNIVGISQTVGGSINTTSVSLLGGATYTVTVTNSEGCTSAPSADIVVPRQLIVPTIPLVAAVPNNPKQPNCITPTGEVTLEGLPATGTWTIMPGAITGTGTSYTVTGLSQGNHSFTVSNGDCTSVARSNIVINRSLVVSPAPFATVTAQPVCGNDTATVNITNLPTSAPITGWTLRETNNYVVSSTGAAAATTLTLPAIDSVTRTYNFELVNSDGCVTPFASGIDVNRKLIVPVQPVVSGFPVQPTCTTTTGSVVLKNLPTGNWTIMPGAITGTGITYTLTGLTQGTYNYTVNNGDCTSLLTDDIVINRSLVVSPAPVAAVTAQPVCGNDTATVNITNLPTSAPITGWTLRETNNYVVSSTGAAAATTLTLPAIDSVTRTYNFELVNSDGCVTPFASGIDVNRKLIVPVPPVVSGLPVQPTCTTTTGSVVLKNLPTGNWTLFPVGVLGSGDTYTATGLTQGTYNFTVNNGDCLSAPAVIPVTITRPLVVPAQPFVSNQIDPTCTEKMGVVTIEGLPTTPVDSWTIQFPVSGHEPVTGNGATLVLKLAANTLYHPIVKNSDGCTASFVTDFKIERELIKPSVPVVFGITQPDCTNPTATLQLSGLPAKGVWELNPLGIFGKDKSSVVVSDLKEGSYTFSVSNADCTSDDTTTVVINAAPVVPEPIQISNVVNATCSSGGEIVLSNLPQDSWTLLTGGAEVNSIQGSGTTFTSDNLIPGEYVFKIIAQSNCATGWTKPVTVEAPNSQGNAVVLKVIQPTCSVATGGVLFENLPMHWTINQSGTVSNVYKGTNSTFLADNLPVGTYTFSMENSEICIPVNDGIVEIKDQQTNSSALIVSKILQPDCGDGGQIVFTNLPANNWMILQNGDSTKTISGVGTTYTLNNLQPGTYNYSLISGMGCTQANPVTVVMKPIDSDETYLEVIQPNCSSSTGTVVIKNLPANWSILQTGLEEKTYTGTNSSFEIDNLELGNYKFEFSDGTPICMSFDNSLVVIEKSSTPAKVDVKYTIVGNILVVHGIPGYVYSIDDSPFTTNLVYNNLHIGTHKVVQKTIEGCNESEATFEITEVISNPNDTKDAVVKVNNAITANGDGVNDVFIIENIQDYPNNTVKIFDVNGKLVYSAEHYDNVSTSFKGESLPEGVYYYFIRYDYINKKNNTDVNTHSLNGYLNIIR